MRESKADRILLGIGLLFLIYNLAGADPGKMVPFLREKKRRQRSPLMRGDRGHAPLEKRFGLYFSKVPFPRLSSFLDRTLADFKIKAWKIYFYFWTAVIHFSKVWPFYVKRWKPVWTRACLGRLSIKAMHAVHAWTAHTFVRKRKKSWMTNCHKL